MASDGYIMLNFCYILSWDCGHLWKNILGKVARWPWPGKMAEESYTVGPSRTGADRSGQDAIGMLLFIYIYILYDYGCLAQGHWKTKSKKNQKESKLSPAFGTGHWRTSPPATRIRDVRTEFGLSPLAHWCPVAFCNSENQFSHQRATGCNRRKV